MSMCYKMRCKRLDEKMRLCYISVAMEEVFFFCLILRTL